MIIDAEERKWAEHLITSILHPLPVQMGKPTQTILCISISACFRLRKSRPKIPQNDKKETVRPLVKLSLYQNEELKKTKEKTGKPLSQIIREAVSRFIRKIIPLVWLPLIFQGQRQINTKL